MTNHALNLAASLKTTPRWLLSGLLDYQLATEYPARLWKARKQLLQLDRELGVARERADRLRRITSRTEVDFAIFDRYPLDADRDEVIIQFLADPADRDRVFYRRVFDSGTP